MVINMKNEKAKKVNRILTIHSELLRNNIINKKDMAELFQVNQKTIQRDIDDMRAYFYNNKQSEVFKEITYIRSEKGYRLNSNGNILTKEATLAIIKILLESRAFSREELKHLIEAVLSQVSKEQRNHIKEMVGNEHFNYVALESSSPLLSKIWDLSEIIKTKEIIEIVYTRMDKKQVKRKIKPVAIIFSEYYFYLIAYFEDYDSPAVFRIDRIRKYKLIGEKFYIPYSQRFEDGEFRKRIQFMYPGKMIKISFEFTGPSVDAVLDRLPTAKIVKKIEEKYIIEAEVYGKGIVMWILSQGKWIKVISPKEIVDEIKLEIENMRKSYK